ncbi:MAG: YheU family protein [Desulfuromonadaceae bacterium]|nr:YheU family protein [Desulfuromonadaceae bacterium]MDD5105450.1 YheU family protein [Desulfuromonadaceae bacterium]
MSQTEVTIVPDQQNDYAEKGVVVPLDRISPDALQKIVEEFVTREWSELSDGGYSMDDKIAQVLQQLKENRAKVVFDLASETCNIVPA